jgi:hypothetical protein
MVKQLSIWLTRIHTMTTLHASGMDMLIEAERNGREAVMRANLNAHELSSPAKQSGV